MFRLQQFFISTLNLFWVVICTKTWSTLFWVFRASVSAYTEVLKVFAVCYSGSRGAMTVTNKSVESLFSVPPRRWSGECICASPDHRCCVVLKRCCSPAALTFMFLQVPCGSAQWKLTVKHDCLLSCGFSLLSTYHTLLNRCRSRQIFCSHFAKFAQKHFRRKIFPWNFL